MPQVQLDDEEWQKVISIIAGAPWHTANPLLMKIGEQLRKAGNSQIQETNVPQPQLASKSTN